MLELCEATEDNPFIHGMSKQFVKALQQLFDVMDTENTGTIKYADLAMQWEEDQNDPFFPKGLITCLAKVTLPNGVLTFDRFCAGIKLCLLKNQVELKEANDENGIVVVNGGEAIQDSGCPITTDRPSSEPKIFAPPPPPPPLPPHSNASISNTSSITTPHMVTNEINNNTSMFNKNASFHSSSSTYSASMANSTNLTDDLKGKKLPLPSYEQVMAAKSKSMSKLTLDNLPATSHQSLGGENNAGGCEFPKMNPQNSGTLYVKPSADDQRRNLNLYENFALLSNESTRYPSDSFTQRAKSMSHLENCGKSHSESATNNEHKATIAHNIRDPTNPTRPNGAVIDHKSVSSNSLATRASNQPLQQQQQQQQHQPKTLSRNCILKTLQSWRDNILNKQVIDTVEPLNGGGGAANKLSTDISPPIKPNEVSTTNTLNANSLRRNVPKRREPRRHTVGANGIDLYAIKRFQQLEQEKEILIRGMAEIDKTKEWYMRQIASIQDKINFAGRSGSFPSDCNIDAYQERINFQAARIQNLSQHLAALREANHNFPLHMNLAIRPFNGVQRIDPNQPKQLVINPNLVNKLKEQNRLLTEEVSRKSDRITQLEREKSSLIRELFQARTYSSYYNGDFDDTFM